MANAHELDVSRIPDNIFTIMEGFEAVAPGSVVLAGGAVRDLILGADISDWDFFVNVDSVSSSAYVELRKILKLFQYRAKLNSLTSDEYAQQAPFQVETWEPTVKYHKPVQLVYSTWPANTIKQLLDTFDVSSCKAALTTDGNLITLNDFNEAANYHYHRVYLKNYHSAAHLIHGLTKHIPKILRKYNWSMFMDYTGVTDNVLKYLGASPSEAGFKPFIWEELKLTDEEPPF